MYSGLRRPTRSDADANNPAAADGDDGYEIPIPSEIAPLPPHVVAYEDIAAV